MILDELKNSLSVREVVSIGILLSLLVVTPFNGVQFILLALVPILYFVTNRTSIVSLDKYDLSWGVFIVIAILSIFWSRNLPLIWYQLFGWLSMIIWMLMSRHWLSIERNKRFLSLIAQGVFWVLLVHQLIAINFEISLSKVDWNEFLFKNSNYTSAYVLGLYSFVLFSDATGRLYRFIRLVGGALVLNILCLSKDPIGALVALAFLVVYYLLSQKTKKVKLVGLLVLPTVTIVVALLIKPSYISYLFGADAGSRLHLMSSSIELFLAQPFTGVGLGQWFNEIYQLPLPDTNPFNHPIDLIRLPSHNLYTEKLAELGVGGFLSLIVGLLYPIWLVIKRGKTSTIYHAASGAILVYVVTSFFYHDVNFHDHHFSNLQLLAFVSIGLITKDLVVQNTKAIYKYILMTLCAVSLIWFIYVRQVHSATHNVINNLETADASVSIDKLSAQKFPIFYNHFKQDVSLDQLIGDLYVKSGNYKKAVTAYEEAIEMAPYNHLLQIKYIESLIALGGNKEEIQLMIHKARNADPYNSRLINLESQITQGERGE